MCIEQFGKGLGENGIGSHLEEWIAFGLKKRKWNTFMIINKSSHWELSILNCASKVHNTAETTIPTTESS